MSAGSAKRRIYPYPETGLSGQIRQSPEDFKVTEKLGFSPSGQGEHLFLYVQKTGLTTHQLIEQLASITGIQGHRIGYAGLKDKHAITRQWLSLHLPGVQRIPAIADTDNMQILTAGWHDKKLRVGVHRSNEFEITIRNIRGETNKLKETIEAIKNLGFANYFGEQRFGRQQDNVSQAIKTLNNRHKYKRLSRNKKSLYVSALRSELYNQILAKRIERGIWKRPIEGDLYMLAGSQSIFSETLSDEIINRYQILDIHSAISLYGIGDSRIDRQAFLLEEEIINANPEIKNTLLQLAIKRALRANRAVAKDFRVDFQTEESVMKIQVELGKGVYLTSLLNHFIDYE